MKPSLKGGLVAGAGATLLIVIAVLVLRNGPLAGTEVTLATAETGDLVPQVFGIGTVEARRAYLIGPTIASRVKQVLVDQGDAVRAGQVLAELDPVDLDERVSSANSALQRAANAIESAEAQLREATSRAAQAQLGAAQRDAARFGAERAGVGKQRAQYHLRSPINGLVTAREAEPGSTVIAGQAVLRLIDPASLWVRARVDQARAAGLAVGRPAQIVLRSQSQAPLPGRVARIEIASDSVTEERIVAVAFDAAPPGASTGELVEVTIALPAVKNALSLPTAAIRRAGQQTGVWRIDNGRAVFVALETGVTTLDGRTEVRTGLARGDAVIHHSPREVKAGERVRQVERLVRQ